MTIDRDFKTLQGDKVSGKAFDNRAGLVAMIEALEDQDQVHYLCSGHGSGGGRSEGG